MKKLLVSWQNYDTCKDCAFHLKRDVINTILYLLAGYYIYPALDPYPAGWWVWNILYLCSISDHLYMLCYPKSPPLPVVIVIIWKMIKGGPNAAAVNFYNWKLMQEKDNNDLRNDFHHTHGDDLADIEKRVIEKKNKRKQEKLTRKKENKEKHSAETNNAEQDTPSVTKELSREEELIKSLGEQTENLKMWEERFEDWSSSKAKELAKLVSEETNFDEQKSAFCRQRDIAREEIARLETESRELAKKIIEADNIKNKLLKKRRKYEDRTDEKLYEHKIEKAKLQDVIQKIKFQMTRIEDNEEKEESNEEKSSDKVNRTHQLAKEIEEKERDLECPVCFELCSKPIFMCDLSHQICKQCRPKMKVCPQCREPYKKHKIRHKAKEMKSDQLQLLYKDMEQLLKTN